MSLPSAVAGVTDLPELPGELIYDYKVRVIGVTEFGVSLEDLMSGAKPIPPAGARFDIAVEGVSDGPRLRGTVAAVDHLDIRADGRQQIELHGRITTHDGCDIALAATGVCMDAAEGSSICPLRENVTLTTAHPEYAWVNGLQIWAVGVFDTASNEVHLKGYAV